MEAPIRQGADLPGRLRDDSGREGEGADDAALGDQAPDSEDRDVAVTRTAVCRGASRDGGAARQASRAKGCGSAPHACGTGGCAGQVERIETRCLPTEIPVQ